MRRIRITGLVRQANELRQLLAQPMSPEQRSELGERLRRSVAEVDRLLSQHRMTARHLPAPSRRAYYFLKEIDLDRTLPAQLSASDTATAPPPSAEKITFRGLRSFLDCLLDDLSIAVYLGHFQPEPTQRIIGETAARLNRDLQKPARTSARMLPQSRNLLAWFRYFAEPEHYNNLIDATHRALEVFGQLPHAKLGWRLPLLVHFRPTSYLYAWRVVKSGTRITLATPMIVFGQMDFARLGEQMCGEKKHRQEISTVMHGPAYQSVLNALQIAGGEDDDLHRGMNHDLLDSFMRVNDEYFDGQCARPRLIWSRTLSARKFGHYDYETDTVAVNSALDRPEVPAFVIDSIVHHELLHKILGVTWHNGRRHVHTPQFRKMERQFTRYEEADAFLHRLARKIR